MPFIHSFILLFMYKLIQQGVVAPSVCQALYQAEGHTCIDNLDNKRHHPFPAGVYGVRYGKRDNSKQVNT